MEARTGMNLIFVITPGEASFRGRLLPRLTSFTSGVGGARGGGPFFFILLRGGGGFGASASGWNVIVSTGPATLTERLLTFALAFGRAIVAFVAFVSVLSSRFLSLFLDRLGLASLFFGSFGSFDNDLDRRGGEPMLKCWRTKSGIVGASFGAGAGKAIAPAPGGGGSGGD